MYLFLCKYIFKKKIRKGVESYRFCYLKIHSKLCGKGNSKIAYIVI